MLDEAHTGLLKSVRTAEDRLYNPTPRPPASKGENSHETSPLRFQLCSYERGLFPYLGCRPGHCGRPDLRLQWRPPSPRKLRHTDLSDSSQCMVAHLDKMRPNGFPTYKQTTQSRSLMAP